MSQSALFAALSKAQAAAVSVEKDATNKFHKYNYASAEAMIAEAKQALGSAGLAVVPSSSLLREPREHEREQGAYCVLIAEWAVVHGDGGIHAISCEWPVIPEKGRPLDKALAAARTASLGYLLRDLLQLPRVEEGTDLDHDSRDNGANQPRPLPPRPQQPVVQPAPSGPATWSDMQRRSVKLAGSVLHDFTTPDEFAYAVGQIGAVTDDTPAGQAIAKAIGLLISERTAEIAGAPRPAIDEVGAKLVAKIRKYISEDRGQP